MNSTALITSTINRVRTSQLAHNAFWMLLGQGLRMVIQAVYFILIARSLGSHGYGAFISATALVGIFFEFVNLGRGNLLIKNVARDPESFARCWGHALLINLIFGNVLVFVVLGVSQVVFSTTIPSSLIFLVAVTDLLFAPALGVTAQAFQAFQRLNRTALIEILPNVLRLVAIVGLSVYVQAPTVLQWACLYFMTTMISAFIGIWLAQKELGSPVFTLVGMKTEMMEGFYFSVSESAQNIYNSIDKVMLPRFSDLGATGIYGAACRIIDVSFSPILSLLYATYARFFQHGVVGVWGSFRFAKRLFPVAGGYGVVIGILLMVTAPLFPYMLGEEYNNAVHALRLLAVLPFLRALHFFAADTLTGAGFQGVVCGIQVVMALFNVGINLWLIPSYGWHGAAWASIATNGLLAVLLCLVLLYLMRKQRCSQDGDLGA